MRLYLKQVKRGKWFLSLYHYFFLAWVQLLLWAETCWPASMSLPTLLAMSPIWQHPATVKKQLLPGALLCAQWSLCSLQGTAEKHVLLLANLHNSGIIWTFKIWITHKYEAKRTLSLFWISEESFRHCLVLSNDCNRCQLAGLPLCFISYRRCDFQGNISSPLLNCTYVWLQWDLSKQTLLDDAKPKGTQLENTQHAQSTVAPPNANSVTMRYSNPSISFCRTLLIVPDIVLTCLLPALTWSPEVWRGTRVLNHHQLPLPLVCAKQVPVTDFTLGFMQEPDLHDDHLQPLKIKQKLMLLTRSSWKIVANSQIGEVCIVTLCVGSSHLMHTATQKPKFYP